MSEFKLGFGFKSGFIGVFGRANVGKSTLVNRLVGAKVSITSHKPQTTRNKILGVKTTENCQMILIDTPGYHKSKNSLGDMMNKEAAKAVSDADIRVLMISAADGFKEQDIELLGKIKKKPVFLLINKVDTIKKQDVLKITEEASRLHDFSEIIPISAKTGDNVNVLTELIETYLPPGPKFFPDDYVTDMPERAIWSEIIRARALLHLQDEVPHGVAVEVQSAVKRPDKDLIDMEVTIYCEKNTHKGIIIGKGGEMLKTIGKEARADLERLMGMAVNMNLWVKVKKDWRESVYLSRTLAGINLDK